MSAFGKMAMLLTSKAKQKYAGQASAQVWQTLQAQASTIQTQLGSAPRGYILVTDTHPSKSDATPHYTVDAYGLDAKGIDKPIGCIHVYGNNTVQAFPTPRSKAWVAYKAKAGIP